MRGRRYTDNTQWTVLLRLSRAGERVYEGEIRPGHKAEVEDLTLEVLWIRQHTDAANGSPTKDKP